MQLKHDTHLGVSTKLLLKSIHPLLQIFSHLPHLIQTPLFIFILKKENFEIRERTAPTGQIELQYIRPLKKLISIIIMNSDRENTIPAEDGLMFIV